MDFLINYGLFLAKLFSIVVAILIGALGLAAIAFKGKKTVGHLAFKPLHKKYQAYEHAFYKITKNLQYK